MYVCQHAKNIPLPSVKQTVDEMKRVFKSNYTRPLSHRRKALKALYRMISENVDHIEDALRSDMGRDTFLAYACDIRPTMAAIQNMLENLEEYNAPTKTGPHFGTFPAVDYVS